MKAQTATETVNYTLPDTKVLAIYQDGSLAPALTFAPPAGGGAAIDDVTSANSWLNYTSIVASGTRKIVVNIASAAPDGTTLTVESADLTGTGGTTLGTHVLVTLSTTPTPLISEIGSCNTGTGAFGAHLTYTWHVVATDFTKLHAASPTVVVTYTLTDAS